MDEALRQIIWLMGGYAIMLLLGLLIAQGVTRGLFFKLLSARMGRGKVLVKVHSVTGPYFVVGRVREEALKYKARGAKAESVVMLEKGVVDRVFGVPYVETDERSNNILRHNFDVVPGHDAQKVDNLMTRIAMLPKKPGSKEIIVIILLIVIVVIAGYNAFKTGQLQGSVNTLTNITVSMRPPTAVILG